jgi:hypothetical protein
VVDVLIAQVRLLICYECNYFSTKQSELLIRNSGRYVISNKVSTIRNHVATSSADTRFRPVQTYMMYLDDGESRDSAPATALSMTFPYNQNLKKFGDDHQAANMYRKVLIEQRFVPSSCATTHCDE